MKVLSTQDELERLGARVYLVVHDGAAAVQAGLLSGLDVPFPVIVDRTRQAYAAWGLRRSSVAGIWLDPKVWATYASLILRGERVRPLGQDTLQLGGDFIVGRTGTLTYARPQTRDDRPPVAELMRRLRETAAR